MQWLMLQQETAKDFVIATGRQASVRDFINLSAQQLGIALDWSGNGANEVGIVKSITNDEVKKYLSIGTAIVRVDPKYFRPAEVETLLGDPTLAHRELGWTPATDLERLVTEMTEFDYEEAKKSRFLTDAGHSSVSPHE